MASDEDYLTELTDLDSDVGVSTQSKKPEAKTWKVKKALSTPRATTYSAHALYEQIHAGDINLDPEYQRDVVWPETKQIMIIDSIFRNFYIPPVIFTVVVHDDGSESKTCIDGKQRLTSIYRFMDGLIPHKDAITGEKLWYKEGGARRGAKRTLMPEQYRKIFANKQVVCVEYQGISEENEREVFQRVQLGMALTPAEKLQVINSPRAIFVREVVSNFMREDGALGPESLNWSTSRGNDFRCLGHSIHVMENSTSKKCIATDFAAVEKWFQSKTSLDKGFKDKVTASFGVFAKMVSDSKHGTVFKKYKKVSPVEFVYTAVFIFMHRDGSSLAQLAAGLSEMFDNVRTIHTDIRMNNRVQKSFTTFIADWNRKNGADDGVSTSERGTKRKKTKKTKDMDVDSDSDEGDDDDEEYKPKKKKPPIPRKVTSASVSSPQKTKQPSPQVKTEPSQPDIPASDRLAAIRKTKEAIAQSKNEGNQANQSIELGTRVIPETHTASTMSTNPQMLPSPAPAFSLPAWSIPPLVTGSFTSPTELPFRRMGPTSPINGVTFGPNEHPRGLPFAPPPITPMASGSNGMQWDRDRDWDRDSDRGRRSSYDDRDHDSRRYEPRRRDSGSYRPRPQDDRDAWSRRR